MKELKLNKETPKTGNSKDWSIVTIPREFFEETII